jgi:hypothetical protein
MRGENVVQLFSVRTVSPVFDNTFNDELDSFLDTIFITFHHPVRLHRGFLNNPQQVYTANSVIPIDEYRVISNDPSSDRTVIEIQFDLLKHVTFIITNYEERIRLHFTSPMVFTITGDRKNYSATLSNDTIVVA